MHNKITIIGGSGFIGTNLCQLLTSKQQDFEIIDLKISKKFPEKCKIADVRIIESLRKSITGDVVVNLAAVHRDNVRNKLDYQHTNVDGAKNLVTVCNEKEIHKIVFTSTVAVYGFADAGVDETGEINPFNEYGRTKFEAEKLLMEWQSNNQNSLFIVRPTVIFGEGNRGNVYNLFNQIALRKFIMIGKGNNRKSMAYIGNIVAFLGACIESKQKFGLFNYSDMPNLTMNELVSEVRSRLTGKCGVGIRFPYWVGLLIGYAADLISKISGMNFPISSIRLRKFVASSEFHSSCLDIRGYKPPFTLFQGIERTLISEFIAPDKNREIFFTE